MTESPVAQSYDRRHPERTRQPNEMPCFTSFHIDPSKSADILKQFLGETFAGVVGCDYAGEYRRFTAETDAVLQFCWAHLIRDVKYLTTLPDAVTCRFGEKLLEKINVLFRLWHRRETTPPER
jgi:hypothetical protein